MTIGFTGTRNGMSEGQKRAFAAIVAQLAPTDFHHGACKGADADACGLVYYWRKSPEACRIVAHPGAFAKGGDNVWLDKTSLERSDEVLPTQTHFARNRAIAEACDVLIACPPYSSPIDATTQGGTAYTVMQARKRSKPVVILLPDGSANQEGVIQRCEGKPVAEIYAKYVPGQD